MRDVRAGLRCVRRAVIEAVIPVVVLAGSVDALTAQAAGLCLDVQDMGPWNAIDFDATPPGLRVPPPTDEDYDYDFPDRIELGAETVFGGAWFTVIVPAASQQTPHSWRFWKTASDTLHVLLGDGFGNIQARVRREGQRWLGTLRTESDNLGTLLYERTISLREARCDSPPPTAASEDAPLPRSVDLAGGDRLVLGESLPQGVATQSRPSGALTVLATVNGRFARPDTVIVVLSRSRRIERIEMRYPSSFDLERLASDLASGFGPARRDLAWDNRTTELRLLRDGPSGRPRVLLMDPRIEREPPP